MKKWFLFVFFCVAVLQAKISYPWQDSKTVQPYKAKSYTNLLGMKGFTDDLLKMHFKLYQGYVKNVNYLLDKLSKMQREDQDSTYTFGALKRRLGWEFDGMRLHELYFENLGGMGRTLKGSQLHRMIKKQYGSFSTWRENFIDTGLIRGIGWVVLVYDPISSRLVNLWINEHDVGHFVTCTPLLVMDVWEHAYITEFGLDRKEYIETFLQNVNWNVVEKRFHTKGSFRFTEENDH